jgi:subtilisin family serine protease
MLATGTRNPRVVGVIPNNQNICLLVARVFGDEVNPGASTSTTDRAAEWCGDMGAKVINLSFGSPTFSTNSAAIYRSLRSEGVLLVSSAGNAQDNSKSYPASYSDVISVSSVDKDLQRFWTSQYNDQVDLAAPGVGIVSTVPGMGLFDELGSEYSTALIDYSPFITSPLTAGVVQCGLGTEPCKDAEGRICLIQVGSNAIDDKAFHCEMGGGVAAVIYNTQFTTAPTRGAINSFVSIPVMGVSYADGLALLSKESITVDLQVPSYTEKRGTSMAAPHVAGVAAKIWAARPACSNNQVRDALEATAKDLGDPGRDDMYGHGLIQAEAAYEYLLALPAPCGIGTTGTPNTIQGSDSDSTPTASSGGSTPTTGGGGSTPTIDRETFLANLAKEGTRSQANDKNSLLKSIQNKTGRVRGGGGVRRRFLKGSKAKQ